MYEGYTTLKNTGKAIVDLTPLRGDSEDLSRNLTLQITKYHPDTGTAYLRSFPFTIDSLQKQRDFMQEELNGINDLLKDIEDELKNK